MKTKIFHSWIIWWGMTANLIWGALLLFSDDPMGATPLSTLADLFGRQRMTLSGVLLMSSIAAFTAMAQKSRPDFRSLVLLIPQQFFLLIAAGGAVAAMFTGQYADGVPRPMMFIMADQLPWVLAAVFYTLSVIEHFGRRTWNHTGSPLQPE